MLFDEVIIEESLHKQSTCVTVGADGDGAMALVKEACRRRGLAWLDIPPWSPHLNPVEAAMGRFKQKLADGGPLTVELAHHVASCRPFVMDVNFWTWLVLASWSCF